MEENIHTLEEELRAAFKDKNVSGPVMTALNEMKKCMGQDDSEVFKKFAKAISLTSKISSAVQAIGNLQMTFACLSNIYQIIGNILKANTKTPEEDKIYSELQRYQDSEIRSEAIGLEDSLFSIHAYLNCMSEQTTASVINTLEDKIYANDTIKFLGKLKGKTHELFFTREVISAYRATTYVNLYFRIAILRTLVLWQVFCIKQQSGSDTTTTQGVSAMITESKRADIEMLVFVTEAHFDKAVFLSVFHPTENENFIHFLQMHEYRIPSIGQEKGFYASKHVIRSSTSPEVKIKMWPIFEGRIVGTKEVSAANEFIFEPVGDRMLDNLIYLHSKRSNKMLYVVMNKNGCCYSVKERPGLEGQWKVIRLENDSGPPYFVLSTLMWPGRFLFLDPILKVLLVKSTYDMEKVREKGVWDIIDLPTGSDQ